MSESSLTTPMPQYGILTASDVMVEMRDGVRLATDIHWPAVDGVRIPGRSPTILGRTSYDKSNVWQWVDPVARKFVPIGYVVVVQDIRGRYKSEGDEYYHTANPWEGRDGYDTIEWIATQEWSNGRIGMVGSSHNSIVQQVVALESPPHLTAIWPDVGPTNIFAHEAREGGAMSMQMFGALFMHAMQDTRADAVAITAVKEAMREMSQLVLQTPFKRGQTALRHFPCLERTLFDYYLRGDYDEWWSLPCCDQEPYWDQHKDIPATHSGGWFDPFSAGTTKYYATMARQNTSRQRLFMGPWTHDSMRRGGSVDGDVDFGPDASWGQDRYAAEQARWFDRWLRDLPNGVDEGDPVQMFIMGTGDGHRTAEGHLFHGGYWRSEPAWPIERAEITPFYLDGSGGLRADVGAVELPEASLVADPESPVPTIGGNIASFYELVDIPELEAGREAYIPWYVQLRNVSPAGPFHQAERPGMIAAKAPYLRLATRPDVLVFQTDELVSEVEVTGSCVLNLWLTTDGPDADITAKLVDVYPAVADYADGYDLNLVDTVLRLRYRNGFETGKAATPGELFQIRVELPPTSNVFKTGHRIRLDIAGSNFPRFDINPNTGEPMGRHTHTRVARSSLFFGPDHPSHVTLPIVPSA